MKFLFSIKRVAVFALILLLGAAHLAAAKLPSASVGGQCLDINGMYISMGPGTAKGPLGNPQQEAELLQFILDNGINYLIMYDLRNLTASSTTANQLASLIRRAKTEYGIHEVGLALGSAADADSVVAYNNSRAEIERIDVLNLEYEFWNQPDRTAAFNHTINTLTYFETVGNANNLQTEIYIGWITVAEGAQLGSLVDRVLIHYYRQTDHDIINYGIERLQNLATANKKVRIAPIFSNEGPTNTFDLPFMGEWLETHAIDQAFKTWIQGYNALTGSWKSNLEVMGSTWYVYDKFNVINPNAPKHITSQPADETVCEGGSATFTVTTSASAAEYCWMTRGRCLSDGGNLSGTKSSTLTISNVSASDTGRYYARVISYDANNPTSNMSDAANLSLNTSCGAGGNLALNKPVTVSSVEILGMEGTRAVDGNSTTRWSSAFRDPQWLRIDLGSAQNISRVKIVWEAAYGKNYLIQTSPNGSSWTTIKSITNNNQLINDHVNLAGAGRYLRILGTQRGTPWGYSIFELEVY